MNEIELHLERARAYFEDKKELARVGTVTSAIFDLVALVLGIVLIQFSSSSLVFGLGLFFIIFGGYGVIVRVYSLTYDAILLGLEFVVDDEVIEDD